jgi:hypothetical protein
MQTTSQRKTNAERQATFRARKAETPEVRGIFAPESQHAAIKEFAAKLAKKRVKKKVLDTEKKPVL